MSHHRDPFGRPFFDAHCYHLYEAAVKAELARVAADEEGFEDLMSRAARDMLAELDRPWPYMGGNHKVPPYVYEPWMRGYSVNDCVRDILYCSDHWDEDRGIAGHDRLRKKYGLNTR